jgi:F0F1-type ATP synthase assembly protein I
MPKESALVTYGRHGALALGVGWSVAAGAIIGYYLDGYLGTSPLLTLLLTVGAMSGAIYALVVSLQRSEKDGQEHRENRET